MWLHLPKATQALTVAEMIKNTGNYFHVHMWPCGALQPNLTDGQRQEKEGNAVLAGRLCYSTLAASSQYKSLATCSSFCKRQKINCCCWTFYLHLKNIHPESKGSTRREWLGLIFSLQVSRKSCQNQEQRKSFDNMEIPLCALSTTSSSVGFLSPWINCNSQHCCNFLISGYSKWHFL